MPAPMPGGLSALKAADDTVKTVYASVASAVEAQANVHGDHQILGYCTQVVAGLNYFIKVSYGGSVLHARVFQDLQRNISLHSLKSDKTAEEAITYF